MAESEDTKRKLAGLAKRFSKLTIGEQINQLYHTDLVVEGIRAQLAAAKAEYDTMEAIMLSSVADVNLDGAKGSQARVDVARTESVSISDWEKFTGFVRKTSGFDLFQRRITVKAWRERVEQKVSVPGTELFVKKSLKLTAVR